MEISLNSTSASAQLEDDFDEEKRLTSIYLFDRPATGVPSFGQQTHHWSLVFDFKNRIITYEAFDVEGVLVPQMTNERPKDQGTYRLIGQKELSPKEVNIIAKSHPLNYKMYILTYNNCQDWVKGLAGPLGLPVNFNTLKESVPLFAHVGAAVKHSMKAAEHAKPYLQFSSASSSMSS